MSPKSLRILLWISTFCAAINVLMAIYNICYQQGFAVKLGLTTMNGLCFVVCAIFAQDAYRKLYA